MKLLSRAISNVAPAVLAGAFFAAAFLTAFEQKPGSFVGGLIVGGLVGLAILGLLRLFPIARWGLPIAGLLAGPVPVFFMIAFAKEPSPQEERGGLWFWCAVLGAVIGLLEWARLSRFESEACGEVSQAPE